MTSASSTVPGRRLLWHWDLAQPDGVTPVAHGLDVAVLAADGRLADVTGLFRAA